jgi:general stress protein 26
MKGMFMNKVHAIDNTIKVAKNNPADKASLSQEEAQKRSLELIRNCNIALLGSVDGDGYPNIKAMIKVETEGLKTVWFSTNTSSKRISQLNSNPKTCVYFYNEQSFKGLMLVGRIDILTDLISRERLWKDGCEIYYPLGVTDPDYSVLRFTASWANYYEGLHNVGFEV